MDGISKAKQRDIASRVEIMEMMMISLNLYRKTRRAQFWKLGRQLGAQSKALETKIKTHDYTQEDKRIKRIDDLIKQYGTNKHIRRSKKVF